MTQDPRLQAMPFSFWQRAGYNFFQICDHFLSRPLTIKLMGKMRYRLFLKTVETLKTRGQGKIIEIEYRTDLDFKEFKEKYVRHQIPVVFKGLAKEWGCVKDWSLDYFKEKHGDDEVPLIDGLDPDEGLKYTSLRELIGRIQAGDKTAYFRFYNLLTRHPEHHADFDLNWLKKHSHKRKYFEAYQIFIGAGGTITHIHNAHPANLFVQAYGRKEWYLYPNYFVPFIDPPSTLNGVYRNAAIRSGEFPFCPFKPDHEGYPYFKYLDGYHVVLEPGDVFFNPPFMWHTVHNQTDSIGVGYRWINAFNSFAASPVYYMLDLMAYRPNYFKSIKVVQQDASKQFELRINALRKMKRKMEKKRA